MGIVFGKDCKLYRNAGSYESPDWNEIVNVKDLTLPLEKSEADVTVRGSGGWRQTAAVLKDGTVTFQMQWDPDDEDMQAIRDAYLNDTSIEFCILDGAIDEAGNQGLRATMDVFTFGRNEPLEEALTVDVTIKPAYNAANAPEWYTSTT